MQVIFLAVPFKDKVKVTFPHGAHLADPDKVFNSELGGKEWRAIDMYKDYKINASSLKALINSAEDYNRATAKTANKPRAARRDVQKKPAK